MVDEDNINTKETPDKEHSEVEEKDTMEEFEHIIKDFVKDILTTFPEYAGTFVTVGGNIISCSFSNII